MLPRETIEAQRKHPIAWWSLLLVTLAPMVVGLTFFGVLLKHLFPSPSPLAILAGGCLLILAIPLLMSIGILGWLLVARRVVPRSVTKAFFIHTGFGMLSRISEWMFESAYGKDDD